MNLPRRASERLLYCWNALNVNKIWPISTSKLNRNVDVLIPYLSMNRPVSNESTMFGKL